MKFLTRTTLVFLFFTGSQIIAHATSWRGITLLQSTVGDVQRLLGPPKNQSPFALYYDLPDEIAVVGFQSESCDSVGGKFGIGWNVPINTVTDIGLIPKRAVMKDRFVVGNNFKLESDSTELSYFNNEKEGILVETYKGIVTLVVYSPPESELQRQCPRLQECCIDFFTKFDEYALPSFEDEKARLDNFVIQMRQLLRRGALVVFGENPARRNTLLKRAQRAKRHLVQTRHLESQRLLIIDGGYRDRSVTELHLYAIGGIVSRIILFPEKDPPVRRRLKK